MRFLRNVTCLLLAGALLAACGSARRSAPLIGERDISDPQVRLGRRTFDAHCHQCHPGGESGLGFALNNKPLPGFLVRFQVRHGVGAMPAFSEEMLSDRELDAVVAYVDYLSDLPAPSKTP